MLYVQYAGAPCEVFTERRLVVDPPAPEKEKIPESSPGRAVKPAARQSVERGQIVSCGPGESIYQSHEHTHTRKGDEQTVR